jgi:aspartate carbamoyltransferase regulatory subunit
MARIRLTCDNRNCIGSDEDGVVAGPEHTRPMQITSTQLGQMAVFNFRCEYCGTENSKSFLAGDPINPAIVDLLIFDAGVKTVEHQS